MFLLQFEFVCMTELRSKALQILFHHDVWPELVEGNSTCSFTISKTFGVPCQSQRSAKSHLAHSKSAWVKDPNFGKSAVAFDEGSQSWPSALLQETRGIWGTWSDLVPKWKSKMEVEQKNVFSLAERTADCRCQTSASLSTTCLPRSSLWG